MTLNKLIHLLTLHVKIDCCHCTAGPVCRWARCADRWRQVAFGDTGPLLTLRPLLRPLLEALFSVVTGVSNPVPRETAITAIGCVAQTVEDDFDAFYPVFCPIAKGVIASSTAPAAPPSS